MQSVKFNSIFSLFFIYFSRNIEINYFLTESLFLQFNSTFPKPKEQNKKKPTEYNGTVQQYQRVRSTN